MSTADRLTPKATGPIPSAFELIRRSGRADWQTAVPTSSEERRWYTVGYAMKDDYELNQPASTTPPQESRLWWALGLVDAKAGSAPRATWRKDEQPEQPEQPGEFPWAPVVAGTAMALTGVALAVAGSRGKR